MCLAWTDFAEMDAHAKGMCTYGAKEARRHFRGVWIRVFKLKVSLAIDVKLDGAPPKRGIGVDYSYAMPSSESITRSFRNAGGGYGDEDDGKVE